MRDTESQYRENLLKAIDEYDMDDDNGGLDALQENVSQLWKGIGGYDGGGVDNHHLFIIVGRVNGG